MGTLQQQLDDVNALIAAENAKGADKDQNTLASLEQKQAVILMQIDDEKAKQEQEAAQQVRIQTQEEKVATIKLPYNFSELYGDSTADDSIIEVVQIFLREANAEHNDELQKLIETHRTEIQAASDRELQLKRQNDELQQKHVADQQEILRISQEMQQTKLERDDAFAKRDAAVADKEGTELLIVEKQAQIDTLRTEIAIGAKSAINVMNVDPSTRLAQLVEQSKNAKTKSAIEIALSSDAPFRGKVEVVAPPKAPEEATFQIAQTSYPTVNGLDNNQASGVPAHDQGVTFPYVPQAEAPGVSLPEVANTNSSVEVAGKTLEERVAALEAHVYGAVSQVA